MNDWKRHKQYHKMVAPVAEIMAEQDRPVAIEINEAGYAKGETIPGAFMMKSSIHSV
jgi:hypothetical protein